MKLLFLIETVFLAENLLGELVCSKAELLAFGVVSSCGFGDFVEPPHCEIIGTKALFGVVSPFSAALYVLRGFIE
ncbi:TPA: hypothetical protein RG678_000955 [Vibrio alginolyticus]|uniref:hypothetical protein n=1 Tax=Vibrio alginolyticus TaxID=663 RepID=UPI001BD46D28|nr:hypothetical protein [Vibrio alginolyticus]MBS9857709.1 hypothetical protein [Vibrio alginolyticus]HDU8597128.1 hypothetical protein [Vibrio alginolyticus]